MSACLKAFWLVLLGAVAVVIFGAVVPPETLAGEFDEFGIEGVSSSLTTSAAGLHPDMTTYIALNHHLEEGRPTSTARVEEVSVSLPPGIVGDLTTVSKCATGDFTAFANCPVDSQVGVVNALVTGLGNGEPITEPLYNLVPPNREDVVARLGFYAFIYPTYIDISVRTASDYGITATVHDASGQGSLLAAETTIWGVPAAEVHDPERLTALEAVSCTTHTACKAPGGKRESSLPEMAFLTNPSACQPMQVHFTATSYQLPGQMFSAAASMDPITGCGDVPFEPSLEIEPTTHLAGQPTGIHAHLHIPQTSAPDAVASSTLRSIKLTLPEGMAIAAGAADGLKACSAEEAGYGTELSSDCPSGSRLGTATITSPSLPEPLHGTIYLRTAEVGHLFRLWLVTDELGLHIKLPGEIHTDTTTGQATTEFRDLPQLPVEDVNVDIWGGDRAPLANPRSCGTHTSSFEMTPWSGRSAAVGEAGMRIDAKCDSGGFAPHLEAGVTQPTAGHFSPLLVNLFQTDSESNLEKLSLEFPRGLLAKLAGVPLCPDAAAVAGACPSSSRIGSVSLAVGPGPQPLQLPQTGRPSPAVYLGGPYRGAPYSVVTETPAQAGPFDLGTVTVRAALRINPETAQASIDSDPLPQFIEGVPIFYRALQIHVDRPDFIINPTNCSELAVASTLTSYRGQVANPSDRFQADGCRRLKFKPNLSLTLRGGMSRSAYPRLTAVLNAKADQASIRRISVGLPHSEFLAQEHIRNICTRIEFAASACPKGSIYGFAKAWTPLLEKPLSGPVYLRSSNNPLPDLVVALKGPVEIDLVGRIDSRRGGIRTTFASVPDAPVTGFVLRMKGGRRGLLVNSTDICRHVRRGTVTITAQNGRRRQGQITLGRKCAATGAH